MRPRQLTTTVALCLSVALTVSASSWSSALAGEAPAASTAPTGQAGMRVYVDPATGALRDAPVGADALTGARAAAAGASTSSVGLVEVVGPTADHGVSVDLQGRFRSTMTVEVGKDGETTTHCATAAAAGEPCR